MNRRLTWLVALTALVALALAPVAGAKGSPKGTVKLSKGTTTLTLDPAVAQTFTTQQVTLTAGKPAKLTSPTAVAFKITNGRVKVADGKVVSGYLKHAGSLTLARGTQTLKLLNPKAVVTDQGATLSAIVNGGRVDLATLDLSAATIKVEGRKASLTGAVVKLNAVAAAALSNFTGATFTDGQTLGTADVATKIIGKGAKLLAKAKLPKAKPAKAKPTTHSHKS